DPTPAPAGRPESTAPAAGGRASYIGAEDDIPDEDDPDLEESALSGHDLIVRELGATVIEEFQHE
ncbi:hypothetical protein, partial [Streptomyces boncukensis]